MFGINLYDFVPTVRLPLQAIQMGKTFFNIAYR